MKVNVGVTGTGSLIGQGILKCLIKANTSYDLKITGFDYFPETIGSFYCSNHYLLPDIFLNPLKKSEWCQCIISAIKKEEIQILFIGVDFELSIFAFYKEKIEKETQCKVIVSSKETIDIGNDKFKTYEFLKQNKISYPETYLPEEITRTEIVFPCILKPRVGARSRDVFIIKNRTELLNKLKDVKNPIIQELIGNSETEFTCGILYLNNKLINTIALKRTLKNGNTETAIFKKDDNEKLKSYLETVALKLKPYGSCNIQLRLDQNGIPKIFEINPRHSGTTYMRALFGFNEVLAIIEIILLGNEFEFKLKEGTALRYFDEKLVL